MILIDSDGQNIKIAKKEFPEIIQTSRQNFILKDKGTLFNNETSLMLTLAGYTGDDCQKTIYYNHLSLPDFWEVTLEQNNRGKVTYWGQKRAIINFRNPVEDRMVHSIDWLDDKGQLAYVETYNDYGKLYTREYYKNNNSLITIYYNKSGQEYAQTVPKSSGIMIINHPQVSGYYANRLTLLTDYLKQNGISDKLVLLDSNLIEDANQAIDCINLNDCRTLRDLVGTNSQLEMIYDFSDSSQRLVDSYIKVVKPRTESSLVKTIFILSASDELEMIEELIEGLQEYHFMIGARTMVSQKFLNLGRNKNVTISAQMSKLDVERALQKCELYLDINHFLEVDYILSRAILYDIPVLSFRDIAHQKAYFYPETIFDKNQIVNFIDYIKRLSTSPDLKNEITLYQKNQLDFCYLSLQDVINQLGGNCGHL